MVTPTLLKSIPYHFRYGFDSELFTSFAADVEVVNGLTEQSEMLGNVVKELS
ncbi:hypothetical protein [Jonesia quinghaiensis]|uniref:hypothetical protein n=1 Tax=Jonesia quinghaiensis TaxID=262806 RepID=UPI0012F79907|nr:hypothetical protein [Jonesia quinghaiensis]